MSPTLPTPLPRFDTTLLRLAGHLVPPDAHPDWLRTWHAELWHNHHRRGLNRTPGSTRALALGLIRDALWLRTEHWRLIAQGTAALCLAALSALVLGASLFALALSGSLPTLALDLAEPTLRFLVASPLVLFVAFATASRRPSEPAASASNRLRRRLFFTAKAVLLLLFAFLFSIDLCQPLHAAFPNTADVLQLLAFTLFALAGLRWAFTDQEQRCKQCLRTLSAPARVGRPSHNLLEWNGTELFCTRGHGLLSIPEIETSWCQSARWTRHWDQTPIRS